MASGLRARGRFSQSDNGNDIHVPMLSQAQFCVLMGETKAVSTTNALSLIGKFVT